VAKLKLGKNSFPPAGASFGEQGSFLHISAPTMRVLIPLLSFFFLTRGHTIPSGIWLLEAHPHLDENHYHGGGLRII
jgi:hypothetical protein